MDSQLRSRLLAAIDGNRLVIFAGAGLSLAPPSNLPSAKRLATLCSAKYAKITGVPLPPDHLEDLELQARHFHARSELEGTFLAQLVDWASFNRSPNAGHFAIADFLTCHATPFAVTTNFDGLIETAAGHLGESWFRSWVEDADINRYGEHAPLLKLHGCAQRSMWKTLWCAEQLKDEPFKSLVPAFADWLRAELKNRDLLFVGFWTDWSYLNDAVSLALRGTEARSVTVIDPVDAEVLREKAPELWEWAHGGDVVFHHVQEGGEVFLDALRRSYASTFLNRVVDSARAAFATKFSVTDATLGSFPQDLDSDSLYTFRRSFCGAPRHAPVRNARPGDITPAVAVVHLFLLHRGATLDAGDYVLGGERVRLINSKGALLSHVRVLHADEPPDLLLKYTVCVGAFDDGAPSDIARGSGDGGIIRGGQSSTWITEDECFAKLGAMP